MALPIQSNSSIFSSDQTPVFSGSYWPSMFTSKSEGLGISIFEITGDVTAQSTVTNYENNVLDSSNGVLYSVLGYSGTTPTLGRAPMAYMYWGAGAPPGVSKAKKTFIHYRGYAKNAGTFTFVFGGQGYVHAFAGGSPIVSGYVHEPDVDIDPTDHELIINDRLGYLQKKVTISSQDQIDIFYWHDGEPWGGIFAKVMFQTKASDDDWNTDWQTFLSNLRDAPILASSSFGMESDGSTPSGTNIPYMVSAQLNQSKNELSTLSFNVAVGESGYEVVKSATDEIKYLRDEDTQAIELHRGYRVEFQAGYEGELYQRFAGHIEDIDLSSQTEAVVTCRDFGAKMYEAFNENYPDKLSYHANGYVYSDWRGEPIRHAVAFDAWPIETAVGELALRSGIDPYYLGQAFTAAAPNFTKKEYVDSNGASYYGEKLFSVREIADTSNKVKIERNPNYGNVGPLKDSNWPTDDEYKYVPDLSSRAYETAKEITDTYGYEFRFNPDGMAEIKKRNTADTYTIVPEGGDSYVTNPATFTGQYLNKTWKPGDPSYSRTFDVYGSRLDLLVGIGYDAGTTNNGGVFSIDLDRHNGTGWDAVSGYPITASTYFSGTTEYFYHDGVTDSTGQNIAAIQVYAGSFDRYRVTVSADSLDPLDGNTNAQFRLDGLLSYHKDPEGNVFDNELTTVANTLKITPQSQFKDLRNQVVVVGRRKAIVTDSAKFEDDPESKREFHVSVSSDVASIYDPTVDNFVGSKRMVVIFDDRVTDSGFADWLSQAVLTRYRAPKDAVNFDHTAIPVLEIGDGVYVKESRNLSIDHAVFVEGITESWANGEATSSIDATSFREIPSYVPRADIDIDTLFNGIPAIDVDIAYNNIYDVTLDNTDLDVPDIPECALFSGLATATSDALPTGTIPETIVLVQEAPNTAAKVRALINMPYRHFWDTSWSSHAPTLTWNFKEGNGTASVYDQTYYDFPDGSTWYYYYRKFGSRTGNNPFYDPYTSELGNLVNISFDALVSGQYRVSIWNQDEAGKQQIPVAWLTNPTAERTDPEAHWTYLGAGNNKTFTWDGVDNIGYWNRLQSRDDYRAAVDGAFGDNETVVGAGFYAWNDQTTSPFSQIGDDTANNYSGSSSGPWFSMGKYGKFYVKIEVKNDNLMLTDGSREPRVVNTHTLNSSWNDTSEAYIWTHLGEPTQVYVDMDDWDQGTYGDWTLTTETNGWVTFDDTDSSINEGKPVRMSFAMRTRPGYAFKDTVYKGEVKLTKEVHLKTTVFDQFFTIYPESFAVEGNGNPPNSQKKRLTSRMYHNDDHTLAFKEDRWYNNSEIGSLTWVFAPQLFKKDFGEGIEEELRYCDYGQLEQLPEFDIDDLAGSRYSAQSHILMAYMNYLFYFSAHTLDRSGRRQWCLNNNFVDDTKIIMAGWNQAVDYVDKGADKYLARSIFTRQWIESGWEDGTYTGSPEDEYGAFDSHESQFIQPYFTDFDPETTGFTHPTSSSTYNDPWMANLINSTSAINNELNAEQVSSVATMPSHDYTYIPKAFGTWTFYTVDAGQGYDGWFEPSPARDFHPYWRMPDMPDWENYGDMIQSFSTYHLFQMVSAHYATEARDPAAGDNWSAFCLDEDYWTTYDDNDEVGPHLQRDVEDWASRNEGKDNSNQDYKIYHMFDYVRQDRLARYEHFRGILSRGPLADPNRSRWGHSAGGLPYTKHRSANSIPLSPAGTYFLNWGKYTYVTTGPIAHEEEFIEHHAVISSFADMRFRAEYVWYNGRYFPVDDAGASMYAYHRGEYTTVDPTKPQPNDPAKGSINVDWWWKGGSWSGEAKPKNLAKRESKTYYDAGAWTGFKDDYDSAGVLKWRERLPMGTSGFWATDVDHARTTGYKMSADLTTGDYTQRNFFDEKFHGWYRFGVSSKSSESKTIKMNLVLPSEFR